MKRIVFFLLLCLFAGKSLVLAQEKTELHQRAETEDKNGNIANARSTFIRAFNDYANKGNLQQGVECGIRATALYYKENYYKEAFDLLRRIDQAIYAAKLPESRTAALRYYTTKERMQMYIKLHRESNAREQLDIMEKQVSWAGDEILKNDLLYSKTIYYYSFGQTTQGNAVFREMANKLTAQKEYDKVEEVYKTLIANGRKSNNASLVAQAYNSYIVWKDSVSNLKEADIKNQLQQQIDDNIKVIDEKDDSLAASKAFIVGLCIVLAILAAVLVLGAVILLRFVYQTRKQKKIIKSMQENNEQKIKFINSISAQLHPTLEKLDKRQPEVTALLDFTDHVQTLSQLENSLNSPIVMEEVAIQPFCEALQNEIRNKVKPNVELQLNVPKMTVKIHKEYVAHILSHLMNNAAEYTPEGGHIRLDFKKRGAHSHQFIVLNTGSTISEENRENIFKPFLEIKDLSQGDGLGLPICKQMAINMDGDLEIDKEFTKGTRFVLSLHD